LLKNAAGRGQAQGLGHCHELPDIAMVNRCGARKQAHVPDKSRTWVTQLKGMSRLEFFRTLLCVVES